MPVMRLTPGSLSPPPPTPTHVEGGPTVGPRCGKHRRGRKKRFPFGIWHQNKRGWTRRISSGKRVGARRPWGPWNHIGGEVGTPDSNSPMGGELVGEIPLDLRVWSRLLF